MQLAIIVTCCALTAVTAGAAEDEATYIPIDLEIKTNQKLDESFHGDGGPGNNLQELPQGEQTFGGVEFRVGEGCIQLGGPRLPKMPEKVPGIRVGLAVAKLHVLHATGWGGRSCHLQREAAGRRQGGLRARQSRASCRGKD